MKEKLFANFEHNECKLHAQEVYLRSFLKSSVANRCSQFVSPNSKLFSFSRLNTLMIGSKPNVPVDRIIWHLVKLFGSPCDYNLIRKCEKLIGFIGAWTPEMKSLMKDKETSLESAVQGRKAFLLREIQIIQFSLAVIRIRHSRVNACDEREWKLSVATSDAQTRASAAHWNV